MRLTHCQQHLNCGIPKWFLLLVMFPLIANAQLNEFDVIEMERPDVAVVQANAQFPDDALLLVYSSLDGLQFRSSMGAVDKQTYNNTAGRYEILVKPVKQMMFVAKPGFMEIKIATINPNAKDVFYYKVEEKQKTVLNTEPGTLKIVTEPSGADIQLNGIPVSTKTPFTGELPAQTYTLSVTKNNLQRIDTSVVVKSSQTTSLYLDFTHANELIRLPVKTGNVRFTANMNGSSIIFQDSVIGLSPLTMKMPTGKHFFSAEYDVAWSPKQLIEVIEHDTVHVNFHLVEDYSESIFTDAKGKSHSVIRFGDDVWFTDNFNNDRYENSDLILSSSDRFYWKKLAAPMYSESNNDCGVWYNYLAVSDDRHLCPVGYHVSTEEDWIRLRDYSEKVIGTSEFQRIVNSVASGCSNGFKLPDGTENTLNKGYYYWIGGQRTSESTAEHAIISSDGKFDFAKNNKKFGFSVRCVQNR